jgi:hypothetical protein
MAEEDKFHVGKPSVFDGNNYDYWNKSLRFTSRLWDENYGEL